MRQNCNSGALRRLSPISSARKRAARFQIELTALARCSLRTRVFSRSGLIRGPFRALHARELVIAATGYSRDFKKLMKSPTWSGSSRNSGMRG